MALTITGNEYSGVLDNTIATRILNDQTLVKLGARKLNAIKGKYVLNTGSARAVLQAGADTPPTFANVTLNHDTFEVCWVMAGWKFGKSELRQNYFSELTAAGVHREDPLQVKAFRDAFVADMLASFGDQLDNVGVQAKYAEVVAYGCPDWGLIRKIEAAKASANLVRRSITIDAAGHTAANIIDAFMDAYEAMPEANLFNARLKAQDRPAFFVGGRSWQLLQRAVTDPQQTSGSGPVGNYGYNPITGLRELTFYGYTVHILPNMPANSVLFTPPSNIIIAVDAEGDIMDLQITDTSMTSSSKFIEVRADARIDYNFHKGAELVFSRPANYATAYA